MSDAPAPVSPAPAKKTAAPKKKAAAKPAEHPPVASMVPAAIKALGEKKGSSLAAIKKYISGNYKVDIDRLAPFIRKFLRKAVTDGKLIQTKGSGASGSFKLNKAIKEEKPVAKKPTAKAKKPKSPAKKPAAKAKKTKTPKKSKPAAAKKVTPKKAKKPAAKKTPKKVAAKKPATKKPATKKTTKK